MASDRSSKSGVIPAALAKVAAMGLFLAASISMMGCRQNPHVTSQIELMGAERRSLEDQIYELEFDVERQKKLIDRLQEENARLRANAAGGGEPSLPALEIDPGGAMGGQAMPPEPEPLGPEMLAPSATETGATETGATETGASETVEARGDVRDEVPAEAIVEPTEERGPGSSAGTDGQGDDPTSGLIAPPGPQGAGVKVGAGVGRGAAAGGRGGLAAVPRAPLRPRLQSRELPGRGWTPRPHRQELAGKPATARSGGRGEDAATPVRAASRPIPAWQPYR